MFMLYLFSMSETYMVNYMLQAARIIGTGLATTGLI